MIIHTPYANRNIHLNRQSGAYGRRYYVVSEAISQMKFFRDSLEDALKDVHLLKGWIKQKLI